MKILEIRTLVSEFGSIDELCFEYKNLCLAAVEAAGSAYAPYSNFKVGAAALLSGGLVIKGSNQENAAYPSGLCAERVALFFANSQYPERAVEVIALTAVSNGKQVDYPVPPCGACRQVLAETQLRFKNALKLILFGVQRVWVIENALDLLPLSFTNKQL